MYSVLLEGLELGLEEQLGRCRCQNRMMDDGEYKMYGSFSF